MTTVEAIVLAIVEGLTEYLPVSSTGHMIIASSLMGIAEDPFTKTFTVAIQFGAILSVVALYFRRFFRDLTFYRRLLVAFIPAAVLGKLFDDYIDAMLGSVFVVAVMLLVGGVILVFIDKWLPGSSEENEKPISDKTAFSIGLFQCISMIPGVSRSAATIIGGMANNLSRKSAAEFSFFLAVPTMFAATVYKVYSFYKQGELEHVQGFSNDQITLLVIGNIFAFIVAMLAIRGFIEFLTKHGFKVFGYYRIIVGVILLVLLAAGVDIKLVD
jgi:undecaprenyl-diphosphatase